MSAYSKPILRFGLVMPGVINCMLLGAVLYGSNKLSGVRAIQDTRYKAHVARLAVIKKLEAQIIPKRKAFEDQKQILLSDPARVFSHILDTLLPKYQDFELQRTGLVGLLDRGRIGRNVQIEAARVKSSYSGGFGPMQEALLQVESLIPQAVLEELKITRKADLQLNKPEHLDFEMTHICWKAQEKKP